MLSILKGAGLKALHNSKLGALIANVEQLIYDANETAKSFGVNPLNEAKALLSDLHGGDTISTMFNFDTYLNKLETFVGTHTGGYGPKLLDIMRAAQASGDPSEVLLSIIETEAYQRTSDFVGGMEDIILPGDFFQGEMKEAEVSLLPNSHMLKIREYRNIRGYFEGDRAFSGLTPREQGLVESMRYSTDEFVKQFPNVNDQGRMHELRTQLQNEMVADGVISQAELTEFKQLEAPFAQTFENYDPVVLSEVASGNIVSDEAIQASLKSSRWQGDEAMKNMVNEFPGETNQQLLVRLQGEEYFEHYKLLGQSQEQINSRFTRYFEIWDAERNAVTKDLGYMLSGPKISPALTPELKSRFLTMLDEGMANGKLSLRGIGSSGEMLFEKTGFKKWVEHQSSNLMQAPIFMAVMMPITMASEEVANTVQTALTVFDLVMSGDPTGLLINGIVQLMNEFDVIAQRTIANEKPDSWAGKRLGYVRRDNKWIPAILHEVEMSTGFMQRNRTVTFETGEEIVWLVDGTGTIVPHFKNPVYERFYTTDDEMSKNYSNKYREEHDWLRDWFLVDPQEQAAMTKSTQLGGQWMAIDTETPSDPYLQKMNDWRRVLDMRAKYNRQSQSQMVGREIVQDYPTSRGLYNRYLKNKGHGDTIAEENFGGWMVGQDLVKKGHEGFRTNFKPENGYLMDTILWDALDSLDGAYSRISEENFWKGDNDLTTATTPDALQRQIDAIERRDVNDNNKRFLTNKAYARYWLGELVRQGGADEFVQQYLIEPYYPTDPDGTKGTFMEHDDGFYKWQEDYRVGGPGGIFNNFQNMWANKGEGFWPVEDVELTEEHQKYVQIHMDWDEWADDELQNKWKKKIDPNVVQTIKEDREGATTSQIGHQVFHDGKWKQVTDHHIDNKGTTLYFADGTSQFFDITRSNVQLRVREIKNDVLLDSHLDKTQALLDEHPEIYDRIRQAHEDIMSDIDNASDASWALYEWFSDFLTDRKTIDQVPTENQTVQRDGEYVEFAGRKFHVDEIRIETKTFKNEVEVYVLEHFGEDVEFDDITPERFPDIAFDANGMPALFGDPLLEEKLNLPENIAAVRDKAGTVQQFYRPEGVTVDTGEQHT